MTASEHPIAPAADHAPEAANPPPMTPAPKKRPSLLWRFIRLLLCLLLVGFLLLMGGLVWLLSTEEGLRFGLTKLPPLAGVSINQQNLQGSVWHGFKGDAWHIETEAANIDISHFDFQWQPQALWHNKLHIQRLAAGDILLVSKPTPPKESSPAKLPDSISLPMAVQLDSLSVGKISITQADNAVLHGGELAYVYDHQQHLITLKHLQSPWSTNQGTLSLHTTSPFALQGHITGGGTVEDIPVNGTIDLGGSLQQLTLDAHLQGGKVKLTAETQISPFENSLNKIIGNLHLKGKGINPVDFLPNTPKADLEFDAFIMPTDAQSLSLEGSIDLANHAAAPADKQGIPVRSIVGNFTINQEGILQLAQTDVQLLKKGLLSLQGSTDTSQHSLNIDAKLQHLALDDIIQQSFADALNGTIQLRGSYTEPKALWALNSQAINSQGEAQLSTDTQKRQQTLLLKQAVFKPKQGGEMNLAGKLELFNQQALQFKLTSKDFNPNKIHADFPVGNINGDIQLDGELAKQIFNGKMNFAPSTLSGVTLRGTADVQYQQQHLSRAISDIALGRNHLRTNGSFGKVGSKLNIDLNAPELDKLGFGLSGALTAQGHIAGDPKNIEANLAGNARNLRIQRTLNIQQLDFKLQGSPDLTRPLNIQLQGKQLVIAGDSPTRIDHVNLNMNGTGTRHTIQGNSSMALDGKPYKLNLAANGGLDAQNHWKGTINTLDISGAFNLKLQNSMNLEAGAERVAMSAARWAAMGGNLNLNSFVWDKKNGLSTKGSANNLHISELHNFFKPPVEHNLVLNSDWDLAYSENARGYLNVRRQSGDVVIFPARKQSLGLSALELQTRFQNGRIDNTIKGDTRFGNLIGNLAISQRFGNDITRAPLNGNLRLNIPDLTSLRNFMPVGQTVKGSLNAQTNIGGTVGSPLLNGTLNGDNLYYINRDIGLILDNGSLRSRLAGQKWHIDSLRFQRGGTITLTGNVNLDKGSPDVNVRAIFDKYHALDKPSRRLTLSGDTKLHYMDNVGVALSGVLKVDDGHFGFQKSSMPTLSDDVVILGEAPKEKSPPTKINLDLTLDLNDRFRFSGEGLDVTLGGKLDLRAKPGQDVQGIGTVSVVKGKYKAYGQDLNISKGAISFVGPLDNPNLNIRAVRNLSPVGAGVEVLGNLHTPRITLVANETMSEKDKLSWLILNRASSGSDGDEAALAAAAGAFLAGNINDKIGLVDDFGMTSKRSRNAQTGELNPAEQVLTVGKQLSSELYLGYEYGINSADQTVKLIYQLTRRIQAIARAGTRSWGGEMKYVIRFD